VSAEPAEDGPVTRAADGSWLMWAHEHGTYQNIGARWWVKIHGLPYPIVPVTVTEVGRDSPDGTHWGWIRGDRDGGRPVMIWAHWGAFGMQFPYGVTIEEERGTGRVVRLRITPRDDPEQTRTTQNGTEHQPAEWTQ
jgi:hypothetical protein